MPISITKFFYLPWPSFFYSHIVPRHGLTDFVYLRGGYGSLSKCIIDLRRLTDTNDR